MGGSGLAAGSLTNSTQPSDVRASRSFASSQLSQGNNSQALVLRPGEHIRREVTDGEPQLLTLALLREQYAQVVFTWRGIDLDVQVLNPNGTQTAGSTGQVRGARSLPVLLLADQDGEYKLIVRPAENVKISGSFEVTFEAPHLPSPADQKRLEAGKLLAEAQQEKSKETAAQKLHQALKLWTDTGDMRGASYTLQVLGGLLLASAQAASTNNSNAGQLTEAAEHYRRAIEIAGGGDPQELAYTQIEIGSDYQRFTSPNTALPYYRTALEKFRELGDRRGEGVALYCIGLADARISHFDKALESFEPALVIQRAGKDRPGEASTLNAIAGVYNKLADQERALSFYQQAVVIWQEMHDLYRAAIASNNIGVIYDDWGDLQTAKDKYLEALAVFKSLLPKGELNSCRAGALGENVRFCNSIANTLDNIGELYSSLGDPEAALATLQDCLAIRKALNQPKGIGTTLSRIAYAYLLDNNPSQALSYCNQALPFSRAADDLGKQGSILTFAGAAHAALNEPDEALELYQQALRLHEDKKIQETRGLGILLDHLGRAYAARKDVTKAFASYNRALAIWQEIKDQEWETRTLYDLAEAERDRGDLMRASEDIGKALQIVESRRALMSSQRLRTSYFANKEEMYELDIDLKMQLSKAQGSPDYLVSALATSEKARARILTDLLSESGLVRQLGIGLNQAADQELLDLVSLKEQVQNKLNFKEKYQTLLLIKKDPQATAMAREVSQLTDEYDELETKIRDRNPRYAQLIKPQPLSPAQIQHQLDGETLLLEYLLGEKRSYVWAVTPDSIKGFELKGRKEIEATAERMIKALTERSRSEGQNTPRQIELHRTHADAEYSAASAELSRMVLQPVAALLGNKRLVIVADGALQLVPFQALPNPNRSGMISVTSKNLKKAAAANEHSLMIEDHEILYEASASVLALQRKEFGRRAPARHALAVLADPVFDQEGFKTELERRAARSREGQAKLNASSTPSAKDLVSRSRADLTRSIDEIGIGAIAQLPQSRDEADAIMKLVPKEERLVALGFDASRATAMNPDLSQYRIIHIATHGFANFKHPEFSGIVLSLIDEKGQPQDGYLRLHDIYSLNLPAELVVLSACQTGVGKQIKGEGLIALTRGFTYAGAARVIASLWKVDDEATRDLMEEFYKQMFTNKLKPAAALRKAQIKLYRQSRWHSPFYWAGFALQGEWR